MEKVFSHAVFTRPDYPVLLRSLKPQLPDLSKVPRALDLGCGDRPIFLEAEIASEVWAADPFPVKTLFPVTKCSAEALDFDDESFELIIARVAFPYTHIPRALREVHRVLSSGGQLWATLHLPRMAMRRVWYSFRKLALVDIFYQFYALLNCFLLCISDFQIQWKGRYESVQSPRSIRNALRRAGFRDIKVELRKDERGRTHFAVLATKEDGLWHIK